jgi:RNA 3'-terminal phosphate cyclase (ATP)
MLEIDGSHGEGGGQVLRTSLALSILTGQPMRIYNIRAKRKNPGLAPQHLAGVIAAAQICGAEVKGAKVRSTTLIFSPGGPAQSGDYHFDVSQLSGQGSAGAVTLVLQAILLPLALAPGQTHLVLRGGTNVAWSPPIQYVEWVLLPTLARMGLAGRVKIKDYGWYPVGGGEVEVSLQGGTRLEGIDLTRRGVFRSLLGAAVASNLPAHIPQRISARANNVLKSAGLPEAVHPVRSGGLSTGTGLFLAANYENATAGFSALGEKGKPADHVADEAASDLLNYHQANMALDSHLPDQLLPAMALAHGPSAMSTTKITMHTLTNIDIIQHFIRRPITFEGRLDQPGVIRLEGDTFEST